MRTLTLALACLLPAAPLLGQSQLWVVDPAGPLTQIRDAVALAASGDTILVRPGGYEAFTVSGKSLVIQGDPRATVYNLVFPPFFPGFSGPAVTVSALAANQRVVLRGLDITNDYQEPVAALALSACAGPVHVEDATLTASHGPAVSVVTSSSLVLQRCTLVSEGPFLPNGAPEYDPNAGLRVFNSQVYVFASEVTGSGGYDLFPFVTQPASDGGPGARLDGGLLYLSGSTLTGGQGGDYDDLFPSGCAALGDGGAGLRMLESGATTSRVVLFDTDPQGGAGGEQSPGCTTFPDGQPGPDETLEAGTLAHVPGEAPGFAWDSPAREGDAFLAHYEGPAGRHAYLFFSVGVAPGVLFEPGLLVLNVNLATYQIAFSGVLPAEGALDEVWLAPPLIPGRPALTVTGQAVYVDPLDPAAPLLVSGPSQVTIVDDGF